MQWFTVDKAGLAAILARRGEQFLFYELLQNAWDEAGVTRVDLHVERITNSPYVRLTVEDDAPDGFADLSHAWTLFASSKKKTDPTKRGRFNLGEKLALALSRWARIETTTGTVTFDEQGRHVSKRTTRRAGSSVSMEFRLTDREIDEALDMVGMAIPPVPTWICWRRGDEPGRRLLAMPTPKVTFEANLPTEVADAEGALRRTTRKTRIAVYEPSALRGGWLFELGIPVVQTGDRFDIDIDQKIPLNMDRDNVSPAFVAQVRALTLNHVYEALTPAEASEDWVRQATGSKDLTVEAFEAVVAKRFGEQRVMADPSDPEATKRAIAAGYTPVYGTQLTEGERANLARARADGHDPIVPAGQTQFKTIRPFNGGPGARPPKIVPTDKWTAGIWAVEGLARAAAQALGLFIEVMVVAEPTEPFSACYGDRRLTFNVGRLGYAWFDQTDHTKHLRLIIHELAHEAVSDHLSDEFHTECCRIGAVLALTAWRS